MAKAAASQIESFWTRLNAVRTKHGLAAVSHTAVTNTQKIQSSQMQALHTQLNAVSSKWLAASTKNIGPYTTGTIIKFSDIIEKTDAALKSMEAACVHNAAFFTAHFPSNHTSFFASGHNAFFFGFGHNSSFFAVGHNSFFFSSGHNSSFYSGGFDSSFDGAEFNGSNNVNDFNQSFDVGFCYWHNGCVYAQDCDSVK